MPKRAHHILIADDEDLVAASMAMLLEQMGHRVTVTHDGLDALQADEADPATLLIADVRMPGMDGFTLVHLIQKRRSKTPAIIITGYSDTARVEGTRNLMILCKPIQGEALLIAANMLLIDVESTEI